MKKIALNILKKLEKYGYQAYIVGGFVRDYILSIDTMDVDIITNATPKEIKMIFKDIILPREDYGALVLYIQDKKFELMTFRKDIKYQSNRKPLKIEYISSLLEDLKRRDFTINTLCMNSKGEIIDLLEGRKDIEAKKIKAVFKNVDKEKTKDIINWNEGGLYTVISILKGNNLCLLIEQIERQFQELEAVGKISSIDQQQRKILLEVYEKISDPREKDFHAQMGELHGILSSMVMSNYGPWLAKSELTSYHINLKDLLISDEQNIILFQFNQLEDEEFTRSFGNIILGDISRVSSMKYEMGNEREVGLYIDEFQAVSPLKIKSILEKVRSSKFLTNLSTQSLQQVIVSSPENGKAVLDSIKDTINNFIVLAGSTEEMAEIFSGVIGKAPKKHIQINFNKKPSLFENYFGMKKESYRYSEQIKEDYIVTPYEFQSLSVPKKENNFKSIGYYITKASSDKTFQKMTRTVAQKLQFILSDEVLEPIPKSFTQTFEENTKLKTSNYNKNDILSLAKEQAVNKNNNIQEDISQKNNVKLKTISLPAIELEEHNINTIQNKPSLPKRKSISSDMACT